MNMQEIGVLKTVAHEKFRTFPGQPVAGRDILSMEKITTTQRIGLAESSMLVNLASRFSGAIWIMNGDKSADARSMVELLMLSARPGDELEILAVGAESRLAVRNIFEMVSDCFGIKD
jgi:phosphotransferase system HPr (HPr) family protein